MAVLKDVVFAYVKIQAPTNKYQSDETEWTVDCVISEKAAKAWKKQFKKQPPKEFDNDDFEKIFKIKPPYPDQEEQFVVKLKKATHFKDKQSGEMVAIPKKAEPKVFENINTPEKPKMIDVTKKKLVSNGSTGVVLYEVIENTFGTFAKLKAIRVDNLIEYKGNDSMDELGEVVDAGGDEPDDDAEFGSVEKSSDSDDAPFEPDDDYDDDVDY
jgi:hypothetical protein